MTEHKAIETAAALLAQKLQDLANEYTRLSFRANTLVGTQVYAPLVGFSVEESPASNNKKSSTVFRYVILLTLDDRKVKSGNISRFLLPDFVESYLSGDIKLRDDTKVKTTDSKLKENDDRDETGAEVIRRAEGIIYMQEKQQSRIIITRGRPLDIGLIFTSSGSI